MNVQDRLRVEISRDVCCQIQDTVVGIAVDALRMPEDQIFVCIAIRAEVRAQVAPRERCEDQPEIGDQSTVGGVDAVSLDIEVRIISLT